ncbi:hypothetical protein IAI10_13485 [Clostridium sp. 19966]|uniref:hypothetical protein n=1 Tax=Clostridium sp. 19966 TaxID=2768166 RepID=UPI0028E06016|nr:hypothetical protein [Clostridium sp. 19966]MDT8717678.1 hypothetical protein [Clostridium sp. 19966]
MNKIQIDVCPFCKSNNIAIGYQLGEGRIFADVYAYHSTKDCANIEHLICKDCGSIIHSRVTKTEIFHQYGFARQNELADYIDMNGILLCNDNKELPSLCGLGYSMENIISLIEAHQVFYCKAYKKRSTYLSIKAYQLLSGIKPIKPLTSESQTIYNEIKKYDFVDKDALKNELNIEKKTFDKAFDFLLENLYITAYSGKRINSSWYSYLYCTNDRWKKEISALHFNGNPKEELWKVLGRNMNQKDFNTFCK